jgi:hypothetical protein
MCQCQLAARFERDNVEGNVSPDRRIPGDDEPEHKSARAGDFEVHADEGTV